MEEETNLLNENDSPKPLSSPKKLGEKGPKMPPLASSLLAAVMERRYLIIGVPLVLSCCIYLVTRSTTTTRAAPSLVKAFIGFRHGSRGPNWTYGTDIYKNNIEKHYPEGREKLTNMGKQEAYELGKRLRERYDEFLGPLYKSDEVKVYSTLMDRTLMSGQIVTASFFPPHSYQVWNDELKWQPIPLYPEYIFNSSRGASCPRFHKEAYLSLHNEFNKLNPSEKEVVLHVMEHAGEPGRRPYEVYARVWDTVYFQARANLPLPEWAQDVFPEKMSEAALKLLKGFLYGSDPQRKLLLSNYVSALGDFFHSKDKVKMEIHSWHDLNNLALLEAIGVNADVYPEPTSCIAIELHERRGHKYFEVFYYDSYKSQEPRQLEMPCGMKCSIDVIKELAEHFQVDDYNSLCRSVNVSNASSGPKMKILA